MGTEMTAFIEYDTAQYDSRYPGAPAETPPPFSDASGTPYSLTRGEDGIYTGSEGLHLLRGDLGRAERH